MLEERLKLVIRDIPDFPKPGILFKDITPVLKDPQLCRDIIEGFVEKLQDIQVDAVAGLESRGFLFGMLLANRLNIPFIPIRKKGKLPFKTCSESYQLEYGRATIEVHEDAVISGSKILIHDDLLATGGTAVAASNLVEKLGAEVVGYTFLISLDFLQSKERLTHFSERVISLVRVDG